MTGVLVPISFPIRWPLVCEGGSAFHGVGAGACLACLSSQCRRLHSRYMNGLMNAVVSMKDQQQGFNPKAQSQAQVECPEQP